MEKSSSENFTSPVIFKENYHPNSEKSPKKRKITQKAKNHPKSEKSPKKRKIAQKAKIRPTWSPCIVPTPPSFSGEVFLAKSKEVPNRLLVREAQGLAKQKPTLPHNRRPTFKCHVSAMFARYLDTTYHNWHIYSKVPENIPNKHKYVCKTLINTPNGYII
jgi:hypothetical protein